MASGSDNVAYLGLLKQYLIGFNEENYKQVSLKQEAVSLKRGMPHGPSKKNDAIQAGLGISTVKSLVGLIGLRNI